MKIERRKLTCDTWTIATVVFRSRPLFRPLDVRQSRQENSKHFLPSVRLPLSIDVSVFLKRKLPSNIKLSNRSTSICNEILRGIWSTYESRIFLKRARNKRN